MKPHRAMVVAAVLSASVLAVTLSAGAAGAAGVAAASGSQLTATAPGPASTGGDGTAILATGRSGGVLLAVGALALGGLMGLVWPRRRRARHAAAPPGALGEVVPLPRWESAPRPADSTLISGRAELAARLGIPTQRTGTVPTNAATRAAAAAAHSARWAPSGPYDRGNFDPRRPRQRPPG